MAYVADQVSVERALLADYLRSRCARPKGEGLMLRKAPRLASRPVWLQGDETAGGLRAEDGVNLIRDSVRLVMHEFLEAEATERSGAATYGHTESPVTDRTGSRPRLLSTKAGDVELRMSNRCKQSFLCLILEPGG